MRQHDGFDIAEAAILKIKDEKHVRSRQAYPPQERDAEQ
jgi:hypothetical protein